MIIQLEENISTEGSHNIIDEIENLNYKVKHLKELWHHGTLLYDIFHQTRLTND